MEPKNITIAVTGKGIISAIGADEDEVCAAIRGSKSGVSTIQHLDTIHKELPCGEVKYSNAQLKQLLGISDDFLASRTVLMAVYAIRQAVLQAGIPHDELMRRRVTLIMGTTVGGMDLTEQFWGTFNQQPDNQKCFRQHSTGGSTELTASFFDYIDDSITISTACSSAANAIIAAAEILKDSPTDIVIAGGSEALTKFHLNGFNSLMILDRNTCRPFDDTRAGLNLGEGAAFLVLENAEEAAKRAVKIQAYLTGYSNHCDAYHQTASSPEGEGAYLAMNGALQSAGLQPCNIQYINAHGTGTANNDLSESVAVKRIFGDKIPPVSSTKPFTGHTTSASGAIEAVICILALNRGFIPGNLGWQSSTDGCITPVKECCNADLQNVMCNSFGFGGNDSSLIFSAHPSAISHNQDNDSSEIQVVAKCLIDNESQLQEIKNYLSPLQSRRMGKLLKSSLLASLKALQQAGIKTPDAIITATAMGCWENTEILLDQMVKEGEAMQKPTFFMQSTHNTISGNIAINTGCHGYNITYSHDAKSLDLAIADAKIQLRSGRCKNVLVGIHDEATPTLQKLMQETGIGNPPALYSMAMVLTLKK